MNIRQFIYENDLQAVLEFWKGAVQVSKFHLLTIQLRYEKIVT